jgi:1,4-dihydroxy-2-naphthoate octaprenyltransferase
MKIKAILWVKAVRAKFYILIMLPVAVGALVAYDKTGSFNAAQFAGSELMAVLVVMASIFANNYTDFDHDKENKTFNILSGHVPADVEGKISKNSMLFGTVLVSAIAILVSCAYQLIYKSQIYIPFFVVLGLAAGFQYSYAPLIMNRKGLGEVFIAVMAGLFSVYFGFATQAGQGFPLQILYYSVPIGLGMFMVMLSAEMSDYDGDKSAGKRTIPIILGKEAALKIYFGSLLLMYASVAVLFFTGQISKFTLVWVLVSLPVAVYAGAHVMHKSKNPPKYAISICGVTKLLYMWINIMLALNLSR